ncbi:hypothetical protein IFO72_08700 [Streptococcus macedonicus]|uniref:DUF6287 domain-containing protein n=1 Tax=Streptococcus macedonicus TaxID=59310 RepID=UPI001896E2EC|nr:DUF6287 domain-containing protein [Streptococcus macedonicus]MBF6977334.1 hypothetical protein [Streptococcus macedonicus]
MKKKLRCYLTLLLSLGLLVACSTHSQNSTNQSYSSTTVSSSVKKSTSSSEISTSSAVSSKSEEASSTEVTLAPINTGAILKADYSTMAGTWQNASGETLTFDDAGLATAGLTADFLDIDQNGILLLDVQTGSKTNVTLYIVPANTSFSSDYLNRQSDNSKVSKDRIISSADISSGDIANKAYYHVSE